MIDKDTADLIRRLEDLIKHLKTGKLNLGDKVIKRIVKFISFFSPPASCENASESVDLSPPVTRKSAIPEQPSQPEYQQHKLFLVIESNKLDKSIKKDLPISAELLSSTIGNAKFAYVYVEGDKEGKKRAQTIWYEDGVIDYTRTDDIVLHLSVLAKSAITNPKADSLAIRRSIQPNEGGKVIEIQKLKWGYFSGSEDVVFHTIN